MYTPDYYQQTTITPLDVIDDWDLGFALGNVIKYIYRFKRKNALSHNQLTDLEKASTYIRLEIDKMREHMINYNTEGE